MGTRRNNSSAYVQAYSVAAAGRAKSGYRFSKKFAWTCSSANRPHVEFSADNSWTWRRANKYDRKLRAIVLSLMTKDYMMTKEDAQKIRERYWK